MVYSEFQFYYYDTYISNVNFGNQFIPSFELVVLASFAALLTPTV
jgi:hypothetical protein